MDNEDAIYILGQEEVVEALCSQLDIDVPALVEHLARDIGEGAVKLLLDSLLEGGKGRGGNLDEGCKATRRLEHEGSELRRRWVLLLLLDQCFRQLLVLEGQDAHDTTKVFNVMLHLDNGEISNVVRHGWGEGS